MKATITRDNYAYFGGDEVEALQWIEDPQQGMAKGDVVNVPAGTVVDLLGDAVSAQKFADLAGVGAVQNQYGENVNVIWPVSLPTNSGKWWIGSTAMPEEQPTDVDTGDGGTWPSTDGSSDASDGGNQPGSQSAGGTDANGKPLDGNAGTPKQQPTKAADTPPSSTVLLLLLLAGVSIYLLQRKG